MEGDDLFRDRITCSKARRRCLLYNKHLADCEFLVGPPIDDSRTDVTQEPQQIFHCHRMILALTSEVFDRMFFGDFEMPNPIRVEDVSPKVFQVFLEYVYTYELDANHLSVADYTELINVGQMYMMKDFVDAVVANLKTRDWNVEHVIPMYEVACLYDNVSLMLYSYKEIRAKGVLLLTHHTFFDMNVDYMKRFVVVISELLPFAQVLRGLENYAERLSRDTEEYDTLVEAAMSMKFHQLTRQEFSKGPALSMLFRNRVQEIYHRVYSS